MALSDWTELEHLSGEIADSQSRLAAARSTQNHGLVKLLERQITEAEKWRDRLLSQITARLTTSPGPAGPRRDGAPARQGKRKAVETVRLGVPPAASEPAAVDTAPAETPAAETPVAETPVAETPVAETGLVEPAAVELAPMDIAFSMPVPVVVDAAPLDPVTIAHRLEGVVAVWD